MHEELDKLAIGHQELGDQVNIPVPWKEMITLKGSDRYRVVGGYYFRFYLPLP